MIKHLIAVVFAVALTACGTTGIPGLSGSGPVVSPAPLAKTTIDDEQLRNAWLAYEAAIDAINIARSASPKILPAGSPKAIALANANDKVLAAFLTAERVAAGLSTTDPLVALAELRAALAEFRTVIGRN